MHRWSLTLSLVALLGPAAAASAQDDARWAEAEQRFGEAEELFDRGDFEGALAEFVHVYEQLEGHPRRFFVLFNIGRCQERLFRYDEALASYRRYLELGRPGAASFGEPLAREQETVRLIAELQQRLATLTIATNAEGAEVWVDDRLVGHAPGDVSVVAGRHTVEVRAPGHAPARQDVQVAARTTQRLTFTLEASFGGLSPILFFTGLAATGASLGVAVGFGAAALAEQSSIDAQLASDDPRERFRVTQARIDANADTARIADILYGVTGVFGIATLVLAFVTDWGGAEGGEAEAAARLRPWAAPGAAGASLGGRF